MCASTLFVGDIVYIELPDKGTQAKAGESYGSVESVKAANDLYAPVSGEIVDVRVVCLVTRCS